MWIWKSDPLAKEISNVFGIPSTPLLVKDVKSALGSGQINSFYNSPLAAIALQWFTDVDYMTAIPLANAAGMVVMNKSYFDKLPGHFQTILKDCCDRYLGKIVIESRKANRESIETLKQHGIKIISVDDTNNVEYFKSLGKQVQNNLIDVLYPRETLDLVLNSLNEFKKSGQN